MEALSHVARQLFIGGNAAASAVGSLVQNALSHSDRNTDGTINSNDLPPALRGQIIARYDRNGDGVVDAADFAPLIQQQLGTLDQNGNGVMDLHDFLTSDQIAQLSAMNLMNSNGVPLDLNNDGVINQADLPAILNAVGTIDINALPDDMRNNLLAGLDRNGDGSITGADMLPIVHAINQTHAGDQLLQQLGDGNGQYSAQQLFQLYTSLTHLANNRQTTSDGCVDLSSAPPVVRNQLLADFCVIPGCCSPEALAPLLDSLAQGPQEATNRALLHMLDRNGDGQVTIADLPPSLATQLQQFDHNGDGVITPDELSPADAFAAGNIIADHIRNGGLTPPHPPRPSPPPAAPDAPPGQHYIYQSGLRVLETYPSPPPAPHEPGWTARPAASPDTTGPLFITLLCTLGVFALCFCVVQLFVRRRRSLDRKSMLNANVVTVEPASLYMAPSPHACSSIAQGAVSGGEAYGGANDAALAATSATRNQGALARARSANAASPTSSNV